MDDIERLIELVSRNEIGCLELKTGGMEIRITRSDRRVGVEVPVPAPASQPVPERGGAPQAGGEPATERAAVEEIEGVHVIKATMVGTFYQSPGPGADPFVQLDQVVRKGQVICIIEAMKIMNEIESEVSGRVLKVFVEDGQPVEYGEPLFAVATE